MPHCRGDVQEQSRRRAPGDARHHPGGTGPTGPIFGSMYVGASVRDIVVKKELFGIVKGV
jgi:hypothetical protein